MQSVQEVIKQDFATAVASFDENDFQQMNICANRIMGNAIFGDSDQLFLPGFFLKDIAGNFLMLTSISRPVAISTAKSVAEKCLSSLKEYCFGEKANLSLAWVTFYQYYKDSRKFFTSEIENKTYLDNLDFTKQSFNWLIKYLQINKQILTDPNNLLLKGITNEFERIFRNHSGDLSDVLAISFLKALDRLYGYLAINMSLSKEIDKSKVENLIFPHIDNLAKLAYSGVKEEQLKEVTKVLWQITKQWRELFLQYLEIARLPRQVEVERAIELSPNIKNKLAESISKTLEKEIKPETIGK